MRIPTTEQMIDENTIAYYPLDGNTNDACGNYNLNGGKKAYYTKVGNYRGGEKLIQHIQIVL